MQTALAVVLLIGALLMGRTLWTVLDIDLGWDGREHRGAGAPTVRCPLRRAESRSRFLAQLADLTAGVPGVELAAPAEQIPFLPGMFSFGRLDTDGASTAQVEVTINHVANRYFPAAEIAILEGARSTRTPPTRTRPSSAGISPTDCGPPVPPSGSAFACRGC